MNSNFVPDGGIEETLFSLSNIKMKECEAFKQSNLISEGKMKVYWLSIQKK